MSYIKKHRIEYYTNQAKLNGKPVIIWHKETQVGEDEDGEYIIPGGDLVALPEGGIKFVKTQPEISSEGLR